MLQLDPMSSCSKAARGLFVLLRTDGIFTVNALSPSSSLRQYPYHYSIRAGQNLPDKEFRYLRTVIVTAAVHRGFSSMLAHLALTFRHRAGVRPYTSTYVLAESCVFVKQSLLPGLCHLTLLAQNKALFIPKLQRQVAEFLQHHSLKRLGILYQYTCVRLGYGLNDGVISWDLFKASSIQ